MKRTSRRSAVLAVAVVTGLIASGCAATTAGGDPSAAPAFPQKGKVVTMIVPYGVGGGSDIGARLLAEDLNQDQGFNIQVENKEGASGQIGITQLVNSKPDGYTISWANAPITSPIYLDPTRQATFGPDDLVPVANYVFDPSLIIVSKDSPYTSLTELVAAAKAKPGKITISASAVMSPSDMAIRALEKAADVKFSTVYFATAGQQRAATLGGQVDAEVGAISEVAGAIEGDQVRGLSVFDSEESKFAPGVPTATSEGYDVEFGSSRILVLPKGTPKAIVDAWSAAVKKASDTEAAAGDFDKFYLAPRYLDPKDTKAYIATVDEQVKDFLADVAKG
jgi:tripartite-type tricarboxylate transporter receptor subunit TctC